MKTIKLSNEGKESLIGKRIIDAGDDYIKLDNGLCVYLSEDEIDNIGSCPLVKTYARKCSHCGCGMDEGYMIAGGEYYYCSDKCLYSEVSEKEWEELYGDGTTDSCYTDWFEDEHEWKEVDGQLVEITE